MVNDLVEPAVEGFEDFWPHKLAAVHVEKLLAFPLSVVIISRERCLQK